MNSGGKSVLQALMIRALLLLTVVHDGRGDVLAGHSLRPRRFHVQIETRFAAVLSRVFLRFQSVSNSQFKSARYSLAYDARETF